MEAQTIALAAWLPSLPQSERQTLATVWDIPESELTTQLQPAYVRAQVATFDTHERSAIEMLQLHNGVLGLSQLEHEFGTIRPHSGILAPRTYLMALQGTRSPLERLFIKGLIHRVQNPNGFTVYSLVSELHSEQTAIASQSESILQASTAPKHWQSGHPIALINNLIDMLGICYHSPLAVNSHGKLQRSQLSQLAQRLNYSGATNSERQWPEASFLRSLALEQQLLQERQEHLRITIEAHQWLQQPFNEQWINLIDAWINMPLDDLRDLVGLRWRNPPLVPPARYARRGLLAILAKLDTHWYDLDQLTQWIYTTVPAFARPDQRFDSWLLTNENDALLGGWKTWHDVDGKLAQTLIYGPLHWLGLIDVGVQRRKHSIRLSGWGQAYLHNQAYPKLTWQPLTVHQQTITVPFIAYAMDRFKTQRIAEWQHTNPDGSDQYQLTLKTFDQALDQHISLEQIKDFLATATAQALPGALEDQLDQWHEQRTALQGSTQFILNASQEGHITNLLKHLPDQLPPYQHLNPQTLAWNAADSQTVIDTLHEHGYALATISSQPALQDNDMHELLIAAEVLRSLSIHHATAVNISQASIERVRKRIASAELATLDRRIATMLAAWGIDTQKDHP